VEVEEEIVEEEKEVEEDKLEKEKVEEEMQKAKEGNTTHRAKGAQGAPLNTSGQEGVREGVLVKGRTRHQTTSQQDELRRFVSKQHWVPSWLSMGRLGRMVEAARAEVKAEETSLKADNNNAEMEAEKGAVEEEAAEEVVLQGLVTCTGCPGGSGGRRLGSGTRSRRRLAAVGGGGSSSSRAPSVRDSLWALLKGGSAFGVSSSGEDGKISTATTSSSAKASIDKHADARLGIIGVVPPSTAGKASTVAVPLPDAVGGGAFMIEARVQAAKEAAAEVLEDDARDAQEARSEYSNGNTGKPKSYSSTSTSSTSGGGDGGIVGAMDAVFYSFRSRYRNPGDHHKAAKAAAVIASIELSIGTGNLAGAPASAGYAIGAVRFGYPVAIAPADGTT
jgi:hypothetical protein